MSRCLTLPALAVAVVTGFAPALAPTQRCSPFPLLIHNVDVWTPAGRQPRRDVLLRDGRIVSIRQAGARPAQGFRTIDGTGHTLLPGLVDAHLHFSIPGGLPTTNGPRIDMLEISARELIQSGVTSGRLHLATLDEAVTLKAWGQDECWAIPRLQVGGPGISGAVEKDFNNFQGARSVTEAIAKVERFAAAGVEWIAVHDAHRFAPDVLAALAAAARKARIRLMAEGAESEEVLAALSIDPDTLDYIDLTTEQAYADEVLERIRQKKNLVLVPTLGVAFRVVELSSNRARLDDPASFGALPERDRLHVIENARKDLAGRSAQDILKYAPTLANKLRQLQRTGLPVALGSDAGSMLHWQSNAVWWEMEAWRSAGASHREVLVAATSGGARVLRAADIGRIALGARADVVLYRGNVEIGPFDRARVIAVAKGGVLFAGTAN